MKCAKTQRKVLMVKKSFTRKASSLPNISSIDRVENCMPGPRICGFGRDSDPDQRMRGSTPECDVAQSAASCHAGIREEPASWCAFKKVSCRKPT